MHEAILEQSIEQVAAASASQTEAMRQAPHVLMRPSLIQDGDSWLAIYGDLPTGVIGTGATPAEAMTDLVERLRDLANQLPRDRGNDAVDDALREAASRISQQDAELERVRREVEEAREEAAERAWMQDKAWMDAVLMLVHHTENAKRTWLVGHAEAARKRDEWWERCKALALTKSSEDIAALDASPQGNAVAWMHTLNMEFGQKSVRLTSDEADQPFGKPGVDFSEEYTVTITPLYAAVPNGWQSVETAPKDGTRVLIHCDLASGFDVQEASYVGGYDSGDVWLTAVGCVYNVKYWRPIPVPPEGQ